MGYNTRFKCRDCGDPLPERNVRSKRPDVCDGCWDARLGLVHALNAGDLSAGTFSQIQRKMAGGRGTAAPLIQQVLTEREGTK